MERYKKQFDEVFMMGNISTDAGFITCFKKMYHSNPAEILADIVCLCFKECLKHDKVYMSNFCETLMINLNEIRH